MLAILLATTSIWRCNAICRESEISCAFSMAHIPVSVPRIDSTSPGGTAPQLTLQKPCQRKKRNEFSDVQVMPGLDGSCCRLPAATMTRQFLPVYEVS